MTHLHHDTTCDHLFHGRIILHQNAKGHRAGTDAVLLAAACPRVEQGTLIDLGSGSGAVGLMAAFHNPHACVVLVERDANAIELATHNIEANSFSERMCVVEADILAPASQNIAHGLKSEMADVVLTNPPFFEQGEGRMSPDSLRRGAHHMVDHPMCGHSNKAVQSGLERWVKTACRILKPHGHILMIHRADAIPALIDTFQGRFGAITITPIYPRANINAHRVLIRAIKGSRAPFQMTPPLVLHDAQGNFTPCIDAMHRGDACF